MRILLLATWLPPAFLTGAESLIVPYAAQHHLAASAPGLMLACVPAGMIADDFAAGRLLRPATRERLSIPLMTVAGLPLLAFAAEPSLPAAAGLLAVTGIGPAYLLGIQRRFLDAVPAPALGQAFSLLATGLMTFQGAGPALFGAATQITPPALAMALAGAAIIITALSLLRSLRKQPRPVGHAAAAAAQLSATPPQRRRAPTPDARSRANHGGKKTRSGRRMLAMSPIEWRATRR